MGQQEIAKLAYRCALFIEERDQIYDELIVAGPLLVETVCQKMSLREAARLSELSPTYLSQVKQRKATISPVSFAVLSQLL